MSIREQILSATVPEEVVSLRPILPVDVIVRGMTGMQRDTFEAGCLEGKGKKRAFNPIGARAKLVAFCCYDRDGARIFTDDDVEQLQIVRADLVAKLASVAQKLSGLTEEDLDELGKPLASLETLPSSPSSSPANSGSLVGAS